MTTAASVRAVWLDLWIWLVVVAIAFDRTVTILRTIEPYRSPAMTESA